MADSPRDESAATGTKRPDPNADARDEGPLSFDAIHDDDGALGPDLDPRRAFEVLEIRTPLEEFESYVRARIDTLSRLGESEKANLAAAALDLGRLALARVTGTALKDDRAEKPAQEKTR
ncbi:hypothetical protein HY251_15070 [bacterium]|nr:hypothetical protein [bacterium]